jgi:uncharacterized protein involved in exopolysaccharide biosynthesis
LEYLPNPAHEAGLRPDAEPFRRTGRRRLWLFAGVFLASLAGSLAYVWLREPVYQAAASVLTVAPADIDQPETAANAQHVSVQRQLLLGLPMLEEIRQVLQALGAPGNPPVPSIDDLHDMLSVEPVADTNLVELRARGSDPELLARAVNAWTSAYQKLRERSVRTVKVNTSTALDDEFRELGRRVEAKRRQLDDFRRRYDIVSKRDTDNQALNRLSGLNTALNKASDEEVKAAAKLDAIKAALARGEPVLAPREAQGLTELEREAQQLRNQIKDMQKRFQPRMALLNPQLKLLPEQLKQVEAAILAKQEEGKAAALSEAEQAVAAARREVADLRRQVGAIKHEVTQFTTRFAEHDALVKSLEDLEKLHRETEQRLVKVEVKPTEDYPQLQIVDYAYRPSKPLWPDYGRDSGIALGASLGLALFAVLLHDLLTRREQSAPSFKLPDIRVFSVSEEVLLARRQAQAAALEPAGAVPVLQDAAMPSLENPLPRELTEPELRMLAESAGPDARQVLGLLLSGVTLEEAAALGPDNLDLAGQRLLVGGDKPRSLPLAPRLRAWLEATGGQPAWAGEPGVEAEDLAAMVHCAAADAGVPDPGTVDAAALRHAYVLYLVRQGLKLAELERVVGRVPAKSLARYARFSPPGPGLRLESVTPVHPVLAAGNTGEAAAA